MSSTSIAKRYSEVVNCAGCGGKMWRPTEVRFRLNPLRPVTTLPAVIAWRKYHYCHTCISESYELLRGSMNETQREMLLNV